MKKLSNQISVSVTENGSDERVKKIDVRIEADRSLFSLVDLLSKEGVLQPLERALVTACREAVREHVRGGQTFLRTMRKRRRGGSERKPKTAKECRA